MPRNSSGTYSLPAGNPVITNTLIETNWANPTMADLGAALTESLDRYGRGGMLAPLKLDDGTVAAPAFAFNSEASTGIYHPAAGVLGVSVLGVQVARFEPAGMTITGTLTASGGVTLGSLIPPVFIGALTALGVLTAALTVSANAAPFTGAVPAGTQLHVVGADGEFNRATFDAVGNGAILMGRRANGTLAAPTAPAINDSLAWFGGGGYDGAAWSTAFQGGMTVNAAEAFTGAAKGTYLTWNTTPNGTTGSAERMRLSDAGTLSLGGVSQIVGARAWFQADNSIGVNTFLMGATYGGTASALQSRSYGGTPSAPAATPAGNSLLSLVGGGTADGVNFSNTASVALVAEAMPIPGSQPTYISLQTTSAGSVTRAERVRVDSAGNVGIGVTGPVAKLDVAGGVNMADGQSLTWAGGSSTRIAASNAAGVLGLYTANIERLRVDAVGNVGIGVAPTVKFHVQGSASRLWSGAAASLAFFDLGTDTTKFRMGVAGGPNDFMTGSAQGDGCLFTIGGNPIIFGIAQIERMRLDGSGNLGIGTATPSNRLHVFSNSASGGVFDRDVIPISGQAIGGIEFRGGSNASASASLGYGGMLGIADVLTAGTQSGSVSLRVAVAGAMTERARLNSAGIFDLTAGYGSLRMGGNFVEFTQTFTLAINATFTPSVTPRSPSSIKAELVCTVAEAGYAVGDTYDWDASVRAGYTGIWWNYWEAANTVVRFVIANQGIQIPNRTTGAAVSINVANWNLRIRMILL